MKNSSETASLVEIVRFLRVSHWLHFLSLPLLSATLQKEWLFPSIHGVLIAAGCLSFAYGLNNQKDADGDASFAKNPLAKKNNYLTPRRVRTILVITVFWSILLSALAGITALAITSFQLIGSALYSSGPRFKGIPIVGTLTNIWLFAPLCFLGGSDLVYATPFWIIVLLFSVLIVQNQLIHEASDFGEDLSAGHTTTAVLLGKKKTVSLSGLCTLPFVAALFYLENIGFEGRLLAAAALPMVGLTVYIFWSVIQSTYDASKLRTVHRFAGLVSGASIWATVYLFPGSWLDT